MSWGSSLEPKRRVKGEEKKKMHGVVVMEGVKQRPGEWGREGQDVVGFFVGKVKHLEEEVCRRGV